MINSWCNIISSRILGILYGMWFCEQTIMSKYYSNVTITYIAAIIFRIIYVYDKCIWCSISRRY